ncbi:hypothetical protein D3C80_1809150 [compost metagenome]
MLLVDKAHDIGGGYARTNKLMRAAMHFQRQTHGIFDNVDFGLRLNDTLFTNDRASIHKTVGANLSTQCVVNKERYSIVNGERFTGFQQ